MEPIGFDIKKAVELMETNGLEVLIANSPENVFYTSGLPTRQAEYNPILFTLANQYPFFVATFPSGVQSAVAWKGFDFKFTWVKETHGIFSREEALNRLVSSIRSNTSGKGHVATESTAPMYLAEAIQSAGFDVVPKADQIFLEMRMTKSAEETRRMRQAAGIAENTIESVMDAIRPGVTEIELTKIAKVATVEKGAMGWDHITLSVGRSDPEYPGVGVPMRDGDISRIDIGAIFSGYTSDVSRNASLGQPTKEVADMYEAILEAQTRCVDKIQPGITKAHEVYDTANQQLAKHGYCVRSHYVGHSIGIQTEEPPLLKPSYTQVLNPGMVFNVEIWVRHEPSRSLGIEDMFLIQKSRVERLSTIKRQLFVV